MKRLIQLLASAIAVAIIVASPAIVVDNFMIRVSENGTIYKFTTDGKSFKLHSSMRYRINGVAPGIESSPVVIGNTVVVGSRGREIYKFEII